jgi:hypothetical protein
MPAERRLHCRIPLDQAQQVGAADEVFVSWTLLISLKTVRDMSYAGSERWAIPLAYSLDLRQAIKLSYDSM